MHYDLQPGVVYLVLGTAEQVQWLLQDIPHQLEVLYHPTSYEMRVAFEYQNLFSDTPKAYLIFPKDITTVGEHGLPKSKYVPVSEDNYYFVICSLISGDVKLTLENGKQLNQAEKVKKVSGHPYQPLDLSKCHLLDKALYGEDKNVYEYMRPFPRTFQRKHSGNYGLYTLDSWEFTDFEETLIESLNKPNGYNLWVCLTNSQIYKYFFVANGYGGEYKLFREGNVSGISSYLAPFLNLYDRAPKNSQIAVPLGQFALWCYLAHSCWSEAGRSGLISYTPKTGKKKERGIKKAYIFKPSSEARSQWLKLLQGEWSKL